MLPQLEDRYVHGLINKSVQGFLISNHGNDAWAEIARMANLPPQGFESMLTYPDSMTDKVLDAACTYVGCTRASLMEDIGVFLVTHPDLEAVRRLMRFGGPTFEDFVLSLDEVHDRACLAVPELTLPRISLSDTGVGQYVITTQWQVVGAISLVSGVLRAMADDYGALVVLDAGPRLHSDGGIMETLSVFIAEPEFAAGRSFTLAERLA